MIIITHDKKFDYDDVLSACILKKVFPNANILRLSKNKLHQNADIIFGMGGVYNPNNGKFDYHQNDFNEHFRSDIKTKMGSSGLLYKHFGFKLLEKYEIYYSESHFKKYYNHIYDDYIITADIINNPLSLIENHFLRNLNDMIKSLCSFSDKNIESATYDKNFIIAMELVSIDLDNYLKTIKYIWIPRYIYTRKIVSEANTNIIISYDNFLLEMIPEIEKEFRKDIKFVLFVYQDNVTVFCVSTSRQKFDPKIKICNAFRGLSNTNLFQKTGNHNFISVHHLGHMAVVKTIYAGFEMIKISIKNLDKQ